MMPLELAVDPVPDSGAYLVAGRMASHLPVGALRETALGATTHAAPGPRFILGPGRGDHAYLRHEGLRTSGFASIVGYVTIRRRGGETVACDGPAGTYNGFKLGDVHQGPAPQVWYGSFGPPKAAAAIAEAFDGVILPSMMAPDATAASVPRMREACEVIGPDPASLRVGRCAVTAPDLADAEARALAPARAVASLQAAEDERSLPKANGWTRESIERRFEVMGATQRRAGEEIADTAFHRIELAGPARPVPDAWMNETCAFGASTACVARLREFRDARVDEVTTSGSTPAQNAELLADRRCRASAPAAAEIGA